MENKYDFETIWLLIKVLFVIGAIIALAIWWIWYVPQKCPPLIEKSTPIYSLDLGNKLEGIFFIGIGNIDENPKYYFYKMEQEGMILDSVNADYTIIQESDGIPRLIQYKLPNQACKEHQDHKKDTLIVPYGTVKKNFNADLASLR